MLPFEDSYVISIDTVKDKYFGSKNKRSKECVEMIFDRSFVYIAPLGPNKTVIKFIFNANP